MFRVAVYHQVWVVAGEDQLPVLLRSPDLIDDLEDH